MKYSVALITIVCLLYSCGGGKTEPRAVDDTANIDIAERGGTLVPTHDSVPVVQADKNEVLMELTKEILTIFKTQQYNKLDTFIHPTEGIRFSPYATVEESDKKFTKESFDKLVTSSKNKKLTWGSYDGSGDPIVLTPNEYFKKFVYDRNFVKPEKAGVNELIGTGNSINNIKSFYRDADFTESHFTGGKSEMDWKSVRLVFKEVNGKYYLVGIVHDQWTI